MIKKLFLALLTLFVSACATEPVPNSEAEPVPNERIIDSSFLKHQQDYGIVVLKRDSGFKGSPCAARAFVNAKPVADIRSSEKITIYLPAGEYIFSALPGSCSGGLFEVSGTVKPGSQLSFRIGWSSTGHFGMFPTAF